MKFTVLGAAGRMGQMHAQHLLEMGHHVYVVDPFYSSYGGVDSRLELAHGIADDSDGVVIATPAARHLRDLERAIEYGRHVFIEKPICLIGETEATRKLLERSDEEFMIVATGYNLRFHPAVQSMKASIASGRCMPMFANFVLRQKPARPLAHFLEEWASHEIDLALHLLGPAGVYSKLIWAGWGTLHPDIKLMIRQQLGTSLIHADAWTEPFRRTFSIIDRDGHNYFTDIQDVNPVKDWHYKSELVAWVDQIERQQRADRERVVIVSKESPLATGWDGLAAIEVLEKVHGQRTG